MNLEKTRAIAEDLLALCKKHNVTIITGSKKDEALNYQFDGLNIFITDGTPSKRKVLDKIISEKMHYESKLTITLNRFNNNNL